NKRGGESFQDSNNRSASEIGIAVETVPPVSCTSATISPSALQSGPPDMPGSGLTPGPNSSHAPIPAKKKGSGGMNQGLDRLGCPIMNKWSPRLNAPGSRARLNENDS